MDDLDSKRVFLGGCAAALVLLAGEAAIEVLPGSGHVDWFTGLGVPVPGESIVAIAAAMGLVMGTLAVWLYAGLLPRYGGGPGTALRVGLAVWVLACAIPDGGLYAVGILPARLFWPGVLVSLLSVLLATLAGSRVYGGGVEAGWTGVSSRRAYPTT